MSVIVCCEEILKSMPDGGRIVTIGSYVGCFGRPTGIPYSVAKAAIHEYTRCLSASLRDRAITVNCIAPGNVSTERYIKEHPTKQKDTVPPDEVASAIAFLCRPEAAAISGQVIRVDKGRHTFPC